MHRLVVPARTILGHRGFLGLLGCTLLLGLTYSFVGPFFSMFGTLEVGMSPVVFGVFMTITSASAIILSTALARWSDTRCSRRSLLLLGGVCGALGYAGYAVVRDVVWLTVIGSLLLGISSITFSQLFAHARELLARSGVSAGDTPLYMNVFRLFFALAWTAGPATASWVMLRYSYRGTFLVAAFCFLLFLLAVLRFIPATPPWKAAAVGAAAPLRQALARPDLLAYFTAFVLIFISSTMGMMNLPLLVLQTLGGNGRHVGIIYSMTPAFELPFMLYFGLLAAAFGHRAVFLACMALCATALAILFLQRARSLRAPGRIGAMLSADNRA
ncbi:MAG: MFS transporter [Opitutaceae bacterium]|nr:MFS transporter [Opitutaceae bacterium]